MAVVGAEVGVRGSSVAPPWATGLKKPVSTRRERALVTPDGSAIALERARTRSSTCWVGQPWRRMRVAAEPLDVQLARASLAHSPSRRNSVERVACAALEPVRRPGARAQGPPHCHADYDAALVAVRRSRGRRAPRALDRTRKEGQGIIFSRSARRGLVLGLAAVAPV